MHNGAGFIDSTEGELDRKTSDMFTIHDTHHQQAHVGRLYLYSTIGVRQIKDVDNGTI